jgi:hypothetical protein
MRTLLSIAIASTVTACAATSGGLSEEQRLSAYEASAGATVSSFSIRGPLNGWTDLGDRHLAVWTTGNEAYLLRLATPCPDLSEAFAIGLTQSGQRVASGFDGVIVRGPVTTVTPGRCMIANIRPVDIEALEAREEEYKTVDMVTREALSLESGGD